MCVCVCVFYSNILRYNIYSCIITDKMLHCTTARSCVNSSLAVHWDNFVLRAVATIYTFVIFM